LDTDFYESTMIELEILFPRLQKGGILIIDDYGHWKGSKLAVDEYFNLEKNFYFMHRIDYASRLLIK
jgi:O-methyltransferase